jgi:hypothetical protein
MIRTVFYERAQKVLETGRVDPFDLVGLTPQFLSVNDERDAVTQLDSNYRHGGGWQDFNGFTLDDDPIAPRLNYPSDPPTEAVAYWELRDERIILFDHAWVAVVQPDGSFRVARMD